MAQMQVLGLRRTQVTEAGVQSFKRAVPGATVER